MTFVQPATSTQQARRPFRIPRGAGKAIGGGAVLLIIVVACFLSPWITPYPPNAVKLSARLMPPVFAGGSFEHLLGTDEVGRDILSRVMMGGSTSLSIGVLAVVVSTAIGSLMGLVAGYFGRFFDAVITIAAEIQLALPSMLIIFFFLAVIGPNIITIALVLALSDWVLYARMVRARTMVERARDYVAAAKVLGAGHGRIIFNHLWPNVLPTILVVSMISLGGVILSESALSYLGLGVQRPWPSWGRMVADGQQRLQVAWWISVCPAAAIATVVFCANLLGDGLRQLWKVE
ncbi:peptide/nickel transport system permease protein [Devosia sp. YR412]|uniref:ABC transporter permease n=1 Tax=Devosia sp. YR412 TaxID=1881030 RepID=UPI0008C6BE34|nr:ABC transporter permease [Devosia sp. YR412]SEQ10655.1 peptide/nickel transport system permease protein [Devosia sp. YR412]